MNALKTAVFGSGPRARGDNGTETFSNLNDLLPVRGSRREWSRSPRTLWLRPAIFPHDLRIAQTARSFQSIPIKMKSPTSVRKVTLMIATVRNTSLAESGLIATHHDLKHIIRQRPLQHLRLIPWRAHPHVTLLVHSQDHRHRLQMDRVDDCVGRCCQEAIETRCGPRIGLDIVPRSARRRQCGRDVCLCPNSHTYDQKSIRLSPFEQTGQIRSIPTPLLEAVTGWGGEMERYLR